MGTRRPVIGELQMMTFLWLRRSAWRIAGPSSRLGRLVIWTRALVSDVSQQFGDPSQAPPPGPPTWGDEDQVPIVDRFGNVRLDAEGREVTISQAQLGLTPDAPIVKDEPDGVERIIRIETDGTGQQFLVEEVNLSRRPGVLP